jgi:hypothetical protein
MRSRIFGIILTGLALIQAGCAAGIRAGGDHHGVGAGAAIGSCPPPAPVPVAPPNGVVYPIPQPAPH